jgi:hypothetical protein
MTNYKKERKIAEAATPEWQKSRYVPHRKYDRMPPEWHKEQRKIESMIFRESGLLGSPGCNPVIKFQYVGDADKSYIAMAHPARYLELLDTIEDQAETIARQATRINLLESLIIDAASASETVNHYDGTLVLRLEAKNIQERDRRTPRGEKE